MISFLLHCLVLPRGGERGEVCEKGGEKKATSRPKEAVSIGTIYLPHTHTHPSTYFPFNFLFFFIFAIL